ncbi:MAG: FAD:protein FMN transferase [Acidobacteriota bacterium]|jgi:thiamine biosynthesis lipoprotein|nr:FAD:protein FMN transferase [Acidobacteriota bacterium]
MSQASQVKDFFAFNTFNRVTAYTDDPAALESVVGTCERFERLFSRTLPGSQIHRINAAGGARVDVAPEVAAFVASALAYCERSGGLFDITMGGVVELWDFYAQTIPERSAVAEALRHVDYRGVHVEGTGVWLDDPRARIDLGGIAKGYIADELVRQLKESGVASGIVNLGGNVAVLGEKPDGSAWRVGLRTPVPLSAQDGEGHFASLLLRDCSVVTSGIYERAFTRGGVLFHHILDPKTGFPAVSDLLGASIVSKRSLDADGYSTALVIMGLDKALDFVEGDADIEAVLVTKAGEVYASSAIGGAIPFEM